MNASLPLPGRERIVEPRPRTGGVRAPVVLLAVAVAVAIAIACVLASAFAGSVRTVRANAVEAGGARAGTTLAERRTKSSLVWLAPDLAAYRGADAAARAPVVYLHGIHGRPENGCPWMRGDAGGLLLCPRADVTHPDGTASWSGARTAQTVSRALELAARGDEIPVLVGFSQGAYELVSLVSSHRIRARGLVLLATHLVPDARDLRAAGVERIVLGAGSLDPTFAPLRREAERLRHAGIDVRLLSLGDVGHVYIARDPDLLRAAVAWASGHATHEPPAI